jgi:serine/threonine protein kinase
MAPEQGRGDGGFDERADVYAVGAVTYALLTGHPPYSAASITEVLSRDPDLPPPSLRPLLHDSVGQLDDIFARALAYNVADRWERADTLAERLEAEAYRLEQEAPLRALERTQISNDDDLPTTVATDPPVRRNRRARAWFLLSLPLVFVLAGVGGWYLFGH